MANVLQVGPNKDDLQLIDALSNIENGDVIKVAPGDYQLGDYEFSRLDITIQGTGTRPSDVTISGNLSLEAVTIKLEFLRWIVDLDSQDGGIVCTQANVTLNQVILGATGMAGEDMKIIMYGEGSSLMIKNIETISTEGSLFIDLEDGTAGKFESSILQGLYVTGGASARIETCQIVDSLVLSENAKVVSESLIDIPVREEGEMKLLIKTNSQFMARKVSGEGTHIGAYVESGGLSIGELALTKNAYLDVYRADDPGATVSIAQGKEYEVHTLKAEE